MWCLLEALFGEACGACYEALFGEACGAFIIRHYLVRHVVPVRGIIW